MDEVNEQGIRKTFQYTLKPTSEQEQALALVVRRCRELYNAAITLQCCPRRTPSGMAAVRRARHRRRAPRPTARRQGGPARIPRPPLPGLAGRDRARGARLPSVLPPRAGG